MVVSLSRFENKHDGGTIPICYLAEAKLTEDLHYRILTLKTNKLEMYSWFLKDEVYILLKVNYCMDKNEQETIIKRITHYGFLPRGRVMQWRVDIMHSEQQILINLYVCNSKLFPFSYFITLDN